MTNLWRHSCQQRTCAATGVGNGHVAPQLSATDMWRHRCRQRACGATGVGNEHVAPQVSATNMWRHRCLQRTCGATGVCNLHVAPQVSRPTCGAHRCRQQAYGDITGAKDVGIGPRSGELSSYELLVFRFSLFSTSVNTSSLRGKFIIHIQYIVKNN